VSLEHPPEKAPTFYVAIAMAILLGLESISCTLIPKALLSAAVLKGITAAQLMLV
jgi:hypothetical protein